VVENAAEAIFVETHSCFRYLNPAAVRLFGAASDSELLNQPVLRTVHPAARAAVAEGIRQAEEQGVISPSWTEKVLRLDGTVLDVEGSAVPFTYEGEKGALVFARDISDRKWAEEELRAKEDLLSESQRIAQLGSWDWTVQPGGSVMTWTLETYRLFDVSPDTFVLSFETFLSLVHPGDRAATDRWMNACLAGAEPPDLEFRVRLQDGGVRHINARGHVVLRDAEHETIRMVGIAQDVTERKRAEETLRRYSGALVTSNKELKRFTQMVLHDLRAPFMNLRGFSAELRGSIDTLRQSEAWLGNVPEQERAAVVQALRETIPEALGFIESSVTRMDQLTSALLRLSRAGEQELHVEELDAGALVQKTLRTLEHQIRGGNVAVKTGPLPRITTDRDAIQEVFRNLLDNAIKYLDPGRPGQIEVSAGETVDATVFRVRDNGRGIARDDMDKVFVPFRRLGPQDVPGDGIGLALVRALLHRLGGRIECHSQIGVGTTFSFTLPRVR
jgi:PAS domain S-box-containing protein